MVAFWEPYHPYHILPCVIAQPKMALLEEEIHILSKYIMHNVACFLAFQLGKKSHKVLCSGSLCIGIQLGLNGVFL